MHGHLNTLSLLKLNDNDYLLFDGFLAVILHYINGGFTVKHRKKYDNITKWYVLPKSRKILLIKDSNSASTLVIPESEHSLNSIQCCTCVKRAYDDFVQISNTATLFHKSLFLSIDMIDEKQRAQINSKNKTNPPTFTGCECVYLGTEDGTLSMLNSSVCTLNSSTLLVIDKYSLDGPFQTLRKQINKVKCKGCLYYNAQQWDWSTSNDKSIVDSPSTLKSIGNYLLSSSTFNKYVEESFHIPAFLTQNPVYLDNIDVYACVGLSRLNPRQYEVYVLDLKHYKTKFVVWTRVTNFSENDVYRFICPETSTLFNFKFHADMGWVCKEIMHLSISSCPTD